MKFKNKTYYMVILSVIIAVLLTFALIKMSELIVLLVFSLIAVVTILFSLFMRNNRFLRYIAITLSAITLIVLLYDWHISVDSYGQLGVLLVFLVDIIVLFIGLLIYAVIAMINEKKHKH